MGTHALSSPPGVDHMHRTTTPHWRDHGCSGCRQEFGMDACAVDGSSSHSVDTGAKAMDCFRWGRLSDALCLACHLGAQMPCSARLTAFLGSMVLRSATVPLCGYSHKLGFSHSILKPS